MRTRVLPVMACIGAISFSIGASAMNARERDALAKAPDEVRAQVTRLKSRKPEERAAAVDALCEMGPAAAAAAPALLAMLNDNERYYDGDINGHDIYSSPGDAVMCVGQLGEAVVPGLLKAVKSRNRRVRDRALFALWQTDDPRVDSVSLDILLHERDNNLRFDAMNHLSPDDPRVVAALVSVLKEDSIGADAASRLGQARNPSTIGPLIDAMAHANDPLVRAYAASALGEFAGPAAIAPLFAAMSDPDSDVRRSVALALVAIGDAQVITRLIAILDTDVMERPYAAGVLAQINDPRVVEPLIRVLSRPYETSVGPLSVQWHFVPQFACEALGKLHDFRATPVLVATLSHPIMQTRVDAARALAELGDPSALDALRTARDVNVKSVKEIMASAVAQLESKQAGAASQVR